MQFHEALIKSIRTEHTSMGSSENTTVFALKRINFHIAGQMDDLLEWPEGTQFGTFNNCREYGVTYSINGWTFCVYEHRNSDEMHLEGCPTDQVQSYGPYGGEDKYATLGRVGPGEFHALAEMLGRAMHAAGPDISRADMRGSI